MMRALPVVFALVAAALGDVDVVVTGRDGAVTEGVWAVQKVDLKASFGVAAIDAAHIASIEFGGEASEATLITDDGTALRGTLSLAGLDIAGDRNITLPISGLKSLVVIRRAEPKAGEITSGVARNRMSYYLRAPEGYDASTPIPAILILHGSNMNSKAYVSTMAAAWPELARDYLLIGIDGEQRSEQSSPENPAFNYTYVNYVGRSKYKGYPGTDRESPALVPEVLAEIKARVPISRIFVGGHSQGGFLAYSLVMNTPELFAGAFPISSGLIVQCEPGAYDNAELIAAQKKVPIAIVHASNDGVVNYSMSQWALESFEEADFPMVRLFTDDRAGHMFARLPVDKAVRWLEAMAEEDINRQLDAAEEWARTERERDAMVPIARAGRMLSNGFDSPELMQRVAPLHAEIERRASETVKALPAPEDGPAWVDGVIALRSRFAGTRAIAPVLQTLASMKAAQQPAADDLFKQAQEAYQSGDQARGRELAERILKECPASDKRRIVKGWMK